VRELEGQLQEVQRRGKAHMDDLNEQLEVAKGVQQSWQGAVGAVWEARDAAIVLLEGAKAVVREREQQLEVLRKHEEVLLQRVEDSKVKVRKEEEKEEPEAITQEWSTLWAEPEDVKAKLHQWE
jgi:hypothetical protein